ncbi:MAG: hypothetical protein GY835_15720 [bacterium]|nr:hypothetical protein [bacterium]
MPPFDNIVGQDPQLIDPGNGNYRTAPGSPAADYGCRTFPAPGAIAALRQPDDLATPAFAWSTVGDRSAIEVSGTIAQDTAWSADTVRVTGNVKIGDGVTLTIAPGVLVEFKDYFELEVAGCLLAVGEPDAMIRFTSREPAKFKPDSTLVGTWGGIRFDRVAASNPDSHLSWCILEYAKALGPDFPDNCGGALHFAGGSGLRVSNSIFRHNAAVHGGALFTGLYASPTIVGCLFTANYAFYQGAAIYLHDSYPRLTNCTIVGNHDLSPEYYFATAALFCFLSKPQTTNCIAWGNTSTYFEQLQFYRTKEFYTGWCNIEGGYPGEMNIDAEPLFGEEWPYPYTLLEGSPCIDAGIEDISGLNLPLLDLAGLPRVAGGRVDMGCHEFTSLTSTPETPAAALALTCHPNPFNPSTRLSFNISVGGRYRLSIHDPAGRRVAVLLDEHLTAGLRELTWYGLDQSGRPLPSGVYLCRLTGAEGEVATARAVLLK